MLCSQWLATGVTCNDVRGAAGQHALNGSQIKRRVNQLSMMLTLGRITRFDRKNASGELFLLRHVKPDQSRYVEAQLIEPI